MTCKLAGIAVFVSALALASGCLTKPGPQAIPDEPPITDEELLVYKYDLTRSIDDSVCRHMQRVYDRYFRQPWNQRPYFRAYAPDVNARLFGYSETPSDESTTFAYEMRYSKYPNPLATTRYRPIWVLPVTVEFVDAHGRTQKKRSYAESSNTDLTAHGS